MKIAIIIPGGLPVPPVKGGAVENIIYTIIKENERANSPIDIDIYGIEAEFKDNYLTDHIHTHYVFQPIPKLSQHPLLQKITNVIKNKLNISTFLNQTLKNLENKSYDYIVVENRPNYVLQLKNKMNSKIILHMHNEHLTTTKKYQSVIDSCYKIFTVSHFIKQTILDTYEVEESKICVVHNGIDTNRFIPLEHSKKMQMRESLNLKESDFVVLFAGRLIKEKGILPLVQAFQKLSNYPDIKLLVVGSKWYADSIKDEFSYRLEEESKLLGEKILFTGYVDYEKVSQTYSMADLAVLPSVWNEPLGLTVLECMSVGLPVISTLSGGIPEIILDDCGTLLAVDESLIDNLAQNILDLYHNPELRTQMSGQARKRIENYFSNQIFYEQFINALNE